MSERPSFEIPVRPERTYPFHGGVEYDGSTRFILRPETDRSERELRQLVERVLDTGPYRYGDFMNLPMALYLIKDTETADVFRLSVRDGTVRLHVLPDTEPAGLSAIYDRLVVESGATWTVRCETTLPDA